MCSPKLWPCQEAGVERLGTGGFVFLLCSLNGSSAAAPRSPHMDGTSAQPCWRCGSAHLSFQDGSKHKDISILFAFPIFIHI